MSEYGLAVRCLPVIGDTGGSHGASYLAAQLIDFGGNVAPRALLRLHFIYQGAESGKAG